MKISIASRGAALALALPLILAACGPNALLPAADASVVSEQVNKAAVLGLYADVYARHDVGPLSRYVSASYREHAPTFADGLQGLSAGLSAQFTASPASSVDIKRVYTDGNVVVVHSLIKKTPDDRGTAAADIYRLEAGKVAEHWGVQQPVPDKSTNANTMFSAPDGRAPSSALTLEAQNKALVQRFDDTLFNKHDLSVIPDNVLETYIQHNPTFPDGRQGLIDGVTQTFKVLPQLSHDLKQTYADNDIVVLYTNTHLATGDRGLAIVDIYRLQGGKIAEHWDIIQPVPETSANSNTMF